MLSKRLLLVNVFLKASSLSNQRKYSTDKKRKKNSSGNIAGRVILYLMLLIYVSLGTAGMALSGMAEVIPPTCAFMLTLVPLLFTLLKANGYLFGLKEYDMLVSMPFEIRDIVSAKFVYMYIKSMLMFAIMSAAMYIGYCIGTGFDFLVLLYWILLTIVTPIIPMVIASAIGAVIVRISSGMKHKSIVQSVLVIVMVIPCFFLQFIINSIIEEDMIGDIMTGLEKGVNGLSAYIPTVKAFEKTICEKNALALLILIVVSAVIFELFIYLVSRSYRRVNGKLSARTSQKKYVMKAQKQRSMVRAIVYKEYKRLTGSSTYAINIVMGVVLALILTVAALFFDAESIVNTITNGAPLDPKSLIPGLPFFVYFLLGMVASTCCTPSLEGKNYWIIKSLPIDALDDCKGKMLFNMLLNLPVGVLAILSLARCFHFSFTDVILSLVLILVQCTFSSVYGLRCGLKHRKLDWDNEIEVVKQGSAVITYMLPNMFASMILMVGVVAVNIIYGHKELIFLAAIVVYSLLAFLSWQGVKKYAK